MRQLTAIFIQIILISFIFILNITAHGQNESPSQDRYFYRRKKMVAEQIAKPPPWRRPIRDTAVLDAMLRVPRHLFVREGDRDRAYGDYPLPIGYGQTISQPYIVAYMTELLNVKPWHRILEIGTGSGYQSAVLSLIAKEIYSVEIITALGNSAKRRLKKLGYKNVKVKVDDGYYGWPEYAPFNGIIVTCAVTHVPPPLINQLANKGRICIPVGEQYGVQYLTIVEKSEQGKITMRKLLPVRFVPLTRKIR